MKRGFTLIELLVVVAIIVVLISLIIPSLNRAREESKNVYCANQLRQMAIGNTIYADEYADRYLPTTYVDSSGWRYYWMNNSAFRTILNLGRTTHLVPKKWICPNAILAAAGNDNYNFDKSYGPNVEGLIDVSSDFVAYKRSTIINPSAKLMFADALDWWICWGGSANYAGEDSVSFSKMAAAYRHRNYSAANIAFFDGHAETLSRKIVDKTFNPSNRYLLWDPIREKP